MDSSSTLMESGNQFPNPATSSQINPPSSSHSSSHHSAAASLIKVNASYDTKKLSSLYASYDYRVLGRQNNHTHHSPYYNSVFLQKLDQELSKLELTKMPKQASKYSSSLKQEHAPSILRQNVLNENFNVGNSLSNTSNTNAHRTTNNNTPNAGSKKESVSDSTNSTSNKVLPKVENRFRVASNVKAALNEQAGKNAKTAAFIVDLNRINKFGQSANPSNTEMYVEFLACFFCLRIKFKA
jgi:hypothetical protein